MDGADQPVALFAALDEEAGALVRHLGRSTIRSPRVSIWVGVIEGEDVVLAVTGVGKVAAALAVQFVCDAFHPRCAVAFGLAGGVEGDGRPGQLVVASAALQHDVDARPLTDAKGIIPSLGVAVFPADSTISGKLRQAAESVIEGSRIVTSGLVLTGDQIVTKREVRDGLLRGFPDGVCFDMETAAIAQAAFQNEIPWAALRVISDAADETFNLEEVFGFGIDTAAGLFDQIVGAFLKNL
jgi:adenosylhomocysteine nucleosidase